MLLIDGRLSKMISLHRGFVVAHWNEVDYNRPLIISNPYYHWYEGLMMAALTNTTCEVYKMDINTGTYYHFIRPIDARMHAQAGMSIGTNISFLDVYIIYKNEKKREKKTFIKKLLRL
jgi:hypothetical protein